MIGKLTYIILILAIALTTVLTMHEGVLATKLQQMDWLARLGIVFWIVSPYILLFALNGRASEFRISAFTICIGTLLIASGGLLLLAQANAMITAVPDPRVDIVYLPIFQWVAVGLLALLQEIMIRRAER